MELLRSIFWHFFGPRPGSESIKMSGSKQEYVQNTISSDKIVIFSKTYCPYCKMAKDAFDKLRERYTLVELDERDDCDEIQDILGNITGARSVPRVFVKGQFLGGGSDVKALLESGELAKLCA
ncbi:uncharacterized protein LOC109608772 isoform X1 [Aethina tumida]|uniref:uncharacterized protein LOC109608772 isoform X1 n=2 Tax=Aethina tumida TaxID=116153 RepID=UPI00096B4157|nr:uncharacterized protein LOC109608772 isoform X1 [Aethina tumida]